MRAQQIKAGVMVLSYNSETKRKSLRYLPLAAFPSMAFLDKERDRAIYNE